MRHPVLASALAAALVAPAAAPLAAQQNTPYQVLQRARVGGEGGWDYIYAAPDGRLYIPRGATREVPATDSTPAVPAAAERVMVYDLHTLAQVGRSRALAATGWPWTRNPITGS